MNKSNVFIHWRLQGMRIFYHEQISHENIQREFFPNYGVQYKHTLDDIYVIH